MNATATTDKGVTMNAADRLIVRAACRIATAGECFTAADIRDALGGRTAAAARRIDRALRDMDARRVGVQEMGGGFYRVALRP